MNGEKSWNLDQKLRSDKNRTLHSERVCFWYQQSDLDQKFKRLVCLESPLHPDKYCVMRASWNAHKYRKMAIRNLMFYKITFLCINLQYYKVYTETLIPKLIAHEFVNASLSANILKILEHYKQTDPVGLPIDAILDPCPIEDVSYLVAVQTLSMKNTRAHGFSRFRIVSVRIDLQALLVNSEYSVLKMQFYRCI